MKNKIKFIAKILLFYALIPFAASIPVSFFCGFGFDSPLVSIIGLPILVLLSYLLIKKFSKLDIKDYKLGMCVNGIALLVLIIVFTVMMFIAMGSINGVLMTNFCYFIFPFAPNIFAQLLMNQIEAVFISAFLSYAMGFVFCAIVSKACNIKKMIIPVICIALCISSNVYLYSNRPAVKYQGHGFDYMNGFSSTDFTDYTVYAVNSKLVSLEHKSPLIIENESEMPVLDGAEACYPLYSAFAKAVYKDIDKIEKRYLNNADYAQENGKIVKFTNTINGFDSLVCVDNSFNHTDLFFGARPSKEQMEFAKECGTEIEVISIGKEAFVFFVEEDNPVDNLTSEQIKSIYHGDINNWKDLGGVNQKIKAFQRPNNSGSQTMMTYFMGDISLKEPQKYETVSAMEGVIKEVAQYNNEEGAIGYTFRYFLEGLNQEQGVKMLSVDGVYPTLESIENGTYPITVDLCLVTRKNDTNPNVQKMKDFILSPDGQYIIHQTGYGKLK